MTIAEIEYTEIDGQLGAIDSSTQPLAIAGQSTTGVYYPRLLTRPDDVIDEYTAGDLVEAACAAIRDWGLPVLCCRAVAADTGEVSLVTTGLTGTSVPSVASGAAPIETNEYRILWVTDGTIGTAGIEYKTSYDGGRTYTAKTALGPAASITLSADDVGTVAIAWAAGTVVADEELIIRTTAPVPTAAEISDAVDMLGVHYRDWDALEVSSPIDATIASALDVNIAAMRALGKARYWMANGRLPTTSEDAEDFLATQATEWGSYSGTYGHIFPGNCYYVSRVSERKCKRPRIWSVAPYIERLPRVAERLL